MKRSQPILLLDFDGVLHSYTSGWKGVSRVPDPPVPGAIEFVAAALTWFKVCIYSARSRSIFGRMAMKRWLAQHASAYIDANWDLHDEDGLWAAIGYDPGMDPYEDELSWCTKKFVSAIGFPRTKPGAFLTIDDRAVCFDGNWPRPSDLINFKPWNKREV